MKKVLSNKFAVGTGVLLLLVIGFSITRCGGRAEVSHNTVEMARTTANENAVFNARKWKTVNVAFSLYKIMPRGDSAQSRSCPSGDGWASIDLVDANGIPKVRLKCSTYSSSINCMRASDFEKKRFAQEEGTCSDEVPNPIPKIAL